MSVKPLNPKFYKHYVDDSINKRSKNGPDVLFTNINNYHPNIKYTIEIQPNRFLDTTIINNNGKFETEVYRKPNKLPAHWSTKTPKRYKRNAINGDLHRSKNISSNFDLEINKIKNKYEKADYPPRFISSVINQYQQKEKDKAKQKYQIAPEKEKKLSILVKIPFCFQNERISKNFINKFKNLTNDKFEIRIKWETKKVKSLFNLKDRNPHPSCVIYEGVCSCGDIYIGETKRNTTTRWDEHEDTTKDSEPARHLKRNNPGNHKFEWKILCRAPFHFNERKNLEASFIALREPNLNNQKDAKKLLLFRKGVT